MKDKEKTTGFGKHRLITAVIWIVLCLLNIFTYSRKSSLIINIVALVIWTVVAIIEIVKYYKSQKCINHKKD